MSLNWTQIRSSQQQADRCNKSCDGSIVCAIRVHDGCGCQNCDCSQSEFCDCMQLEFCDGARDGWWGASKQVKKEWRKEGTEDKAQNVHAYDRNPLESGKSGVQVVGFPCQLQQTDNFMKPVFLSARFLCHGKPCIVQILLGLLSQDFFHTHIVLSMLNCHVGW